MASKKKVVILGGGMAALAAAYELSQTQALRDRFDVVLYQRGWRLGGKCASGRAPHPADPGSLRIEEHGLHVWFGFYFNAFAMMHDCYGQLADPAVTFDTMFARRCSTPLMERVNGHWSVWPLTFPPDRDGVKPGIDPGLPSLNELVERLLAFLYDNLKQLAIQLEEAREPAFVTSIAWLHRILVSPAWANETVRKLQPEADPAPRRVLVTTALAHLLDVFSRKPQNVEWREVRKNIGALALTRPALSDRLRRIRIMVDLAAAAARGVGYASSDIIAEGFSALDGYDLREWLGLCGAEDESVASAPVRALYDLCFAYKGGDTDNASAADFAAGAALRCVLRISFAYRGAVCYTVTTGMGEAVVAPLYRVLQANGVRFAFFHKVERLAVTDGAVTGIDFTLQAEVTAGDYQPLKVAPGGLRYWGARPDFAQITNGAMLQAQPGIDFESDLSAAWGGETAMHLDLTQADGSLATVILGISVASLGSITAELAEPGSRWQRMLAGLPTVATQSAQLWMNVDLAGLGYPLAAPPCMIAAPEPQDVWADMSAVIVTEGWSPAIRPLSVQYLCGPLRDQAFSSVGAAVTAARQGMTAWLAAMTAGAWPGAAAVGGFRWDFLVASQGTQGPARLADQLICANISGSDRYVLSVAGSTLLRLRPDARPASNLYLAGDWTRNGIDAGCVEAAVISGLEAARAVRGDPPYAIPGAQD